MCHACISCNLNQRVTDHDSYFTNCLGYAGATSHPSCWHGGDGRDFKSGVIVMTALAVKRAWDQVLQAWERTAQAETQAKQAWQAWEKAVQAWELAWLVVQADKSMADKHADAAKNQAVQAVKKAEKAQEKAVQARGPADQAKKDAKEARMQAWLVADKVGLMELGEAQRVAKQAMLTKWGKEMVEAVDKSLQSARQAEDGHKQLSQAYDLAVQTASQARERTKQVMEEIKSRFPTQEPHPKLATQAWQAWEKAMRAEEDAWQTTKRGWQARGQAWQSVKQASQKMLA